MSNLSAVPVLIAALAAFRVARLLIADTIFARPISWVEEHAPAPIGYALNCWWCSGLWASMAIAALTVFAPSSRLVAVLLLGLALSTFVGWSAEASQRGEAAPEPTVVFNPAAVPNVVGVDRDALLDLRSAVMRWVGDLDMLRARAKVGALTGGEAVAWQTIDMIESLLSGTETPTSADSAE